MSESVSKTGSAVPLEFLVRRAREIMAVLPPMQNCNELCRAGRAVQAALDEVYGRRNSWTVFSQYIPQLAQGLGRSMFCQMLAKDLQDLRNEGCTAADIQQVASGQFGTQNLSAAALNSLAFVLRERVGAYVVGRLIAR